MLHSRNIGNFWGVVRTHIAEAFSYHRIQPTLWGR